MSEPKTAEVKVPTRPTVEQELERFKEALEAMPDIAERHAKGQQFNAYDVSGEDEGGDYGKFVCLGPVHSRPVSLVEVPSDVGALLEAALRTASALSAAPASPPAETGEGVNLERIAKDAAERVHKNGGCVPQLAFAPILFALQDALSAQPVSLSDGGREPTAWLYTENRWKDGPRYRLSMKRQAISPEDANEFEITEDALYTRPASDQSDTERMRAAFDYVCGLLPSATLAMDREADNYVLSCMVNIGELRHVRELRAALAKKEAGQ